MTTANQVPPAGWSTNAEVVKVIDGDTIKVKISRVVTIRILDCWTPESRTKDAGEKELGMAAKKYLQELLARHGNCVHVFIESAPDLQLSRVLTMGRFLGRVWLPPPNNQEVAKVMRIAGHAAKTKEEQQKKMQESGVKGRFASHIKDGRKKR